MESTWEKSFLDREKLSKFAGCISNPTLITIMEELASKGCCVKDDFIAVNGLSRLNVALNLKYLKKYGLINGSLTARSLSYCMNYDKIEEFKMLFDNFYNHLIEHKKKLENKNCIDNGAE